jgi:tripartite-type tricarboxylate transporter receptor subunit TctC
VGENALAQAYPVKPLRLIIPFPPGGPRDLQARLIGPTITAAWVQTLVIDNRAHANGTIGTGLAAKSPLDADTMVMISAGFANAEVLYGTLPDDSPWGFVAVTPRTQGPGILVESNVLPLKSADSIALDLKPATGEVSPRPLEHHAV